MKLSIQTRHTISRFGFEKGVTLLRDAGFDCLDLTLDNMSSGSCEWNGPDFRELAKSRREFCDANKIEFNQAHAPYAMDFANPENRKVADERVLRSIEIAAIMGVKIIVVHPLHYSDYKGHEDEWKQINLEYYRSLIPVAEKLGIKIAVENMWRNESKRGCISFDVASTAADLADYVDKLNSPNIVACLDIGHSSLIGEEAQDAIRFLGPDRLQALHVHDNNYRSDMHQLPGLGKMDFTAIMQALSDIGYRGDFTYEADVFLHGFDDGFYPTAAKFMVDTARYWMSKMKH